MLVAQAVAIALGALPVFWLARKHLGSERAGLGFALAYLLYPGNPVGRRSRSSIRSRSPARCSCSRSGTSTRTASCRSRCSRRSRARRRRRSRSPLRGSGPGTRSRADAGWRASRSRSQGSRLAAFALGVVQPHFRDGGEPFAGRYEEVGGSPAASSRRLVTDPLKLARAAVRRARARLPRPPAPAARRSCRSLHRSRCYRRFRTSRSTCSRRRRTQTSIHFHYVAPLIPALFAATIFAAAQLRRDGRSRSSWRAMLVAELRARSDPRSGRAFPGGEDLQARSAIVSDHDRIAARALRVDPRRRRCLCVELARRAPLRAATVPQLPDPRRTPTGSRWTSARPATSTASRPGRTRPRSQRLRRDAGWRSSSTRTACSCSDGNRLREQVRREREREPARERCPPRPRRAERPTRGTKA